MNKRENLKQVGLAAHRELGQRKMQAARLSIASNAILVLLKLIVGFWSGSVGILSEALHSASDLLASGIAYFAVRVSDTPPDHDHPYGHGKVESVSGVAEALLIFGAAGYIIYEALHKLRNVHDTPPNALEAGILLMGFSAGINFFLARYLHRIAQETDSLALSADAEHLRTDALTSVGVLVGLTLVVITGKNWFDPATALCVALLIIHASVRLFRASFHPLLDSRLPVEEEGKIRDILEAETLVLGYHKLRTRKSGSQRHADVHVLFDDDMRLVEAHDLAEQIEDKIRGVLPATLVNIHIEPYHAEMQHQEEVHGVPRAHPTPKP